MMVQEQKLVRYAVAVFDDRNRLAIAGNALQMVGGAPFETAYMASRSAFGRDPGSPSPGRADDGRLGRTEEHFGSASKHEVTSGPTASDMIDLTEIGRVGRSEPILSSIGALADMLLGVGAGRDAGLGGLLRAWLPAKQSDFLEEQLATGKILLWVRIQEPDHEAFVCRSLLKHSPYRVQVHDLRSASAGRGAKNSGVE